MQIALTTSNERRANCGIVLAEAVIAVGLSAMMSASILYGFVVASRKLAWATYSSAAQAVAISALEQGFSCRWDPTTGVDEMTNLVQVQTNWTVAYLPATNYLTYTDVTNNSSRGRAMTSTCVWSMGGRTFTNTVPAFRAPNYE
jgi:hypothetical protein